MSAERTTSAACTVCTTLTPSNSNISKVHLELHVVHSPTKATAMALEALPSHAKVKPGKPRDPAWARTASKELSRTATLCQRLNLGMKIPGTTEAMTRGGESAIVHVSIIFVRPTLMNQTPQTRPFPRPRPNKSLLQVKALSNSKLNRIHALATPNVAAAAAADSIHPSADWRPDSSIEQKGKVQTPIAHPQIKKQAPRHCRCHRRVEVSPCGGACSC